RSSPIALAPATTPRYEEVDRIVLRVRHKHAHALAPLRAYRERPSRRAAEQRDERAPSHVDFALPLIASPSSACHPASLIFTRATSVILPSVAMRSACADASPARTSSISSSAVNPFANISASVQPSGDAASSSRARRRSGLGPRRRRWGWGIKLAVVAARDLAAQEYHAEPHFSETKSPPWVGGVRWANGSQCNRFPSLRLDVGRPDHLAPLLGFIGEQLAEVGR